MKIMSELDRESGEQGRFDVDGTADEGCDAEAGMVEKHRLAMLMLVLGVLVVIDPAIKFVMQKLTAPVYGETSGTVKPADNPALGENAVEK